MSAVASRTKQQLAEALAESEAQVEDLTAQLVLAGEDQVAAQDTIEVLSTNVTSLLEIIDEAANTLSHAADDLESVQAQHEGYQDLSERLEDLLAADLETLFNKLAIADGVLQTIALFASAPEAVTVMARVTANDLIDTLRVIEDHGDIDTYVEYLIEVAHEELLDEAIEADVEEALNEGLVFDTPDTFDLDTVELDGLEYLVAGCPGCEECAR